jgi:adenylate cyclase
MNEKMSEVREWLFSQELSGRGPVQAGEQLCEKLLGLGVPISRAHVLVLFLHPLYHARSVIWSRGEGAREENWSHGLQSQAGWKDSVFFALTDGDAPDKLHFDLRDPEAGAAFPMLAGLRADGITEYLALRMRFSDGSVHAVSFATTAETGFSEGALELFAGLQRAIAIRLENAIRRELSYTVLGAYLGRNAAKLVLEGRIRREDTETISAAVWMSDLRGFTALSDRLSRRSNPASRHA